MYLKFIMFQKTSIAVVFTLQDQIEKHSMGIVSHDYAIPAQISLYCGFQSLRKIKIITARK